MSNPHYRGPNGHPQTLVNLSGCIGAAWRGLSDKQIHAGNALPEMRRQDRFARGVARRSRRECSRIWRAFAGKLG